MKRGANKRQGEARAACTVELSASAGAAPDWVHLLPAGRFEARDDREPWELSDAATVIAATLARKIDLVVDYEHQTDLAEKNGQPAPAAGWIREIEARADGIWGRVEWTERAREMIARREYRFLSPVFAYERASRRVKALLRAGLTNNPALHLIALARFDEGHGPEGDDMDELLEKLRKVLELAGDADEKAVCAAIETLKASASKNGDGVKAIAKAAGVAEDTAAETIATAVAALKAKGGGADPAKFVPVEQHREVATALAKLQGEVTEDKATAAVDKAIGEGKLIPAQRDWGLALFKSDRQAWDSFAASAPVIVQPGRTARTAEPPKKGQALTADELAVCTAMGLDPEAFKKTRDAALEETAR